MIQSTYELHTRKYATRKLINVEAGQMFVGRTKELNKLEAMYNSDKFEFAIIYGRRRVGKTTLIHEFCKGKKAIYSVGSEVNKEDNLAMVSRDIFHAINPDLENPSVFTKWEDVFNYVEGLSQKERLILVLDEYLYFAKTCPEISSLLQAHIDRFMKQGKLFIILCGSSMSFMENQVLGYESPLYGRRTAQFKIYPFNYWEARQMVKHFTPIEQAILYGATGGVPEYLANINPKASLKDNILSLFLSDNGVLFAEPETLLKQELREPAIYNSVIGAIAQGASRPNEISGKAHLENNVCNKYLSTLISLGILNKENPITETNSKKSLYYISDLMFRFWYTFVAPNRSRIISGDGEQVYKNNVEPEFSSFMGATFEKICLEYLEILSKYERSPFFLQKIGRWWGNNPLEKREEEIDLLAFFKQQAAFVECKWRNEKVDVGVLQDLERKAQLFPQFPDKYYYVFSKGGFTVKASKFVEEKAQWHLVSFADMCNIVDKLENPRLR